MTTTKNSIVLFIINTKPKVMVLYEKSLSFDSSDHGADA